MFFLAGPLRTIRPPRSVHDVTHVIMPPRPLGPAPPPGSLLPPNEHLPSQEAHCLVGHEGPVLAVRFNSQGTYCLSCGKVRGQRSGGGDGRLAATECCPKTGGCSVCGCSRLLAGECGRQCCSSKQSAAAQRSTTSSTAPLSHNARIRTERCGCGTRTEASLSKCTQGMATMCAMQRWWATTASEKAAGRRPATGRAQGAVFGDWTEPTRQLDLEPLAPAAQQTPFHPTSHHHDGCSHMPRSAAQARSL